MTSSKSLKIIKCILLAPISIFYIIYIKIRNILYDFYILNTHSFNKPIIIVGNIHVGGTGKTPLVIYLANIFKKKFNVAILSRGYKRKTKGLKEVHNNSLTINVGDEALMIKQKVNPITVYVAEKRVPAIKKLQNKHQIFILDDGFQHRKLNAGLNIILIPYNYILKHLSFLPFGLQRDFYSSIKRAHIVLITKSPKEINTIQKKYIERKLHLYSKNLCIYFSYIEYLRLVNVANNLKNLNINDINDSYTIILVTGLASNKHIVSLLKTKNCNVIQYQFKDHYYYTNNDIDHILNRYLSIPGSNKIILTTEKDYVKLKELNQINRLKEASLYYLSFKINISGNKEHEFIQFILNYISKYSDN